MDMSIKAIELSMKKEVLSVLILHLCGAQFNSLANSKFRPKDTLHRLG